MPEQVVARRLPGASSAIGVRALLALSRRPGPDRVVATERWVDADPLRKLRRSFAGFDALVRGRDVLDFGCGAAHQAVAMAALGARVTGIDTNAALLEEGRRLAQDRGVSVTLAPSLSAGATFDVVVSQNSMEHFPDPAAILTTMRGALRPGGQLLITFGPPWYAPFGAHMHFFTAVPWVHLLFPESVVLAARQRFRADGAMHYEDVPGGLNRMSVAKFERLTAATGLRVVQRRYGCIKGMDAAQYVPGLRELCINEIACVLSR